MTDIIGSIFIGISIVSVWYIFGTIWNWTYGKIESYRYERWKNKNLGLFEHAMRRKKR